MTDSQDEFVQSSSGYSRDKFYVAASDGQRGATQVNIKFPASVIGELSAMVARQALPDYRTPHDVIRNGLVHQLHYDVERIKDPLTVARLQALNEHLLAVNMLQDVSRMQQTEEALESLAFTISPKSIRGKQGRVASSRVEAALALLADRPDLQAILQSKMNGT